MIELKYSKGEVEITAYQEERTGTIFLTQNGLANLLSVSQSAVSKYVSGLETKGTSFSKMEKDLPDGRRIRSKIIPASAIADLCEKKQNAQGLSFCQWAASLARPSGDNALEKVEFIEGNSRIEVLVSPEEETVWLTQEQIGELFETTRVNVAVHIKNILSQGELSVNSVCKENLHTALDGKRYQTSFHSLDMVLAIGYHVNSKRGIQAWG